MKVEKRERQRLSCKGFWEKKRKLKGKDNYI